MRANGEDIHMENHDVDLPMEVSAILKKKLRGIFIEAMKDDNSFENSLLCIFLTGVAQGVQTSSAVAKPKVGRER